MVLSTKPVLRILRIQHQPRPRGYAVQSGPTRRPPPPPSSYRAVTRKTTVSTSPANEQHGADKEDPGREAAIRAVKEGKSDSKYKPAERRVTAIIVALPIFLVTSYFLYQRRFMGVEQKKLPGTKPARQDDGSTRDLV